MSQLDSYSLLKTYSGPTISNFGLPHTFSVLKEKADKSLGKLFLPPQRYTDRLITVIAYTDQRSGQNDQTCSIVFELVRLFPLFSRRRPSETVGALCDDVR